MCISGVVPSPVQGGGPEPYSDPVIGGCDGLVVLIPSDAESLPASENSTPAKSSASLLSGGSGCSSNSGSLDEPSDFERFRGPYLSTRELLNDVDYDRPASSETGAMSDASSQPEHLEHPSVNECWIVTPPPCFVGSERGEITTSPLENLLIEHPSMSVYQPGHRPTRRMLRAPPLPPTVELQPNLPANTPRTEAVMFPPPVIPVMAARRAIPIRHHIPVAVQGARLNDQSTLRAVSARSRRENSRRSIDRCNHVAATTANSGVCRRRQHRAMRNSGMNIDRHCQ